MYDFYKILGVTKGAGIDEIKKAYREKAKLHHPDINDDPKANEFFAVINEAYTTLCDENARFKYDLKLKYGHSSTAKKQPAPKTQERRAYSSFHYDWDSYNRAANFRSKKEEKTNPFIYNLFFGAGMFAGFFLCFLSINAISKDILPTPAILVVIPGLVLIWDGWQGIAGSEYSLHQWLYKKYKQLRK